MNVLGRLQALGSIVNKYLLIVVIVLLTNVQSAESWEQTEADKKQILYEAQQYLYKASPDWACGGICYLMQEHQWICPYILQRNLQESIFAL